MKDEFDDNFINWAKAVIVYSQRNCTKSTAIHSIIKNIDLECKLIHIILFLLFTVTILIFLSQK